MNRIRQKNLEDISKFTVIPDGWKEVTIQEVCNIGRGRVISQEEIKSNLGIYPVYSSQTRNNGRMGSIDTYDFDGEFITWTTDGENAGTVFHRLGKFNCTNVCGTLTAKDDEVDHSFLSYHLGRIAKSYVSYIGNPKLMNGVMGDIGLILPPLDEQQKIAKILRTVDNLIEKTQTLIEKYTAIKQGMMADLFTRGIDMTTGDTPNSKGGKLRPSVEDAAELYKQTELGWVPKEWEVLSFGELADYKNGNSFSADSWKEEGYPIIRIQNLNGSNEYNYYEGPVKKIWHILPGDLLFAWSGQKGVSFGARVWNGPEGVLNQHIFKVYENSKLLSRQFLYYLFKLNVGRIEDNAHGFKDSFVHVTRSELTDVTVMVPPKEEQAVIEQRVIALDRKLEQELGSLEKYKKLKKGLMQDLLTGRVKVYV